MRTVRQVVTTGGTLLTALLVLLSYSAAQDSSPTLRTLHNFTGGSDGGGPWAGVVIGTGGVLYGTTRVGGTFNNGTVFSLAPPASSGGAWTETVLHNFAGAPDGANPFESRVAIGPGGVLYGTTYYGGTSNNGMVFSLTQPASPGGAWTETVLRSFAGSPTDGGNPQEGVVIAGDGVLFGTTAGGGISDCAFGGCGIVFSLKPPPSPGDAWTETVLHGFTKSEGSNPEGGVVIGTGVLYGTTYIGGTAGNGTVFSLTPPGGGPSVPGVRGPRPCCTISRPSPVMEPPLRQVC